ncbi:MAG: hypothetical protein KC420_10225 [Myxococcales bacterium]|nr:hypothetical protein [Myxococcales bacterium]
MRLRLLALLSTLPLLACAGGDDGSDSGTGSTGSTGSTSTSGATTSGGTSSGGATETGGTASATGTTASTGEPGTTTSSTGSTSDAPTTGTSGTSGVDTDATTGTTGTSSGGDTDATTGTTGTTGGVMEDPLWISPNLWYSVEDRLHYIEIDKTDGSVVQLVSSTITTPLLDGFNGLTMLEDGSLLGSRVLQGVGTQIFHVPEPPVVASDIEVKIIGMVPDKLLIEALYTDCKGLVYLMDSGVDLTNAIGNRLIRFTGDYLAGDLGYEVITDLQNASVADIDDMGPGINKMGEITDGEGIAIDSGTVYNFDYNTGTGTQLGKGGTWGTHALGGPLFNDDTARLYLLDINAQLFEADPVTLALSPALIVGPKPAGDAPAGWSGLTGPLTACESTLPQ